MPPDSGTSQKVPKGQGQAAAPKASAEGIALTTLLTLGHFQMAALGICSTRANQLIATSLSFTCNNFWRRENYLRD